MSYCAYSGSVVPIDVLLELSESLGISLAIVHPQFAVCKDSNMELLTNFSNMFMLLYYIVVCTFIYSSVY